MKNSKKKSSDPLAGDLSPLFDRKDWKHVRYELKPKNKVVTLRMSESLLEAIKLRAEREGLDYQKWIRLIVEEKLGQAS
ncbi:MAG: BrnA antitoxin family protein [Bacteriovoracaceae bacterium]|nr:BrnA antitoxin family protein [Bacteriovoracaceae bacterium]